MVYEKGDRVIYEKVTGQVMDNGVLTHKTEECETIIRGVTATDEGHIYSTEHGLVPDSGIIRKAGNYHTDKQKLEI